MIVRAAALVAAVVLSLAGTATAHAARFAVGIAPNADHAEVRDRLEAHGATHVVDLTPIAALTVTADRASTLRSVPGVRYVEALGNRRQSYVPNDPLLPQQWYAAQNRSFDAWTEPPPLAAVRVAVIDSGVDGAHPELRGRIVAAKSFVKGPATVDTQGHGTFVAGLIAARTNDGIGIAGLAPPAQLVIAKVVGAQGSIPVEAEAKAVRWAVAKGARVINMSLSGPRDPTNASRDTYSKLEADAVAYAVSKGVLVVAAVGNADQSPAQPWPYASWPAALPHVLGVSALTRRGGVPAFSNRDPQFNDIAAPGEDILSTLPLRLTALSPECREQGYSSCGPDEYRSAEGTSFATPQVTAAAAMLIATSPGLAPDQVLALLEQSAVDARPANGCFACTVGHDRFTGSGRLDQTAAIQLLAAGTPPRDRYEPNDGAGAKAYPLFGATRDIAATLDYWNDRDDVYRVYLRAGERLDAITPAGGTGIKPALSLWRPGAPAIDQASVSSQRILARPAGVTLSYRASVAGWYLLDVRLVHASRGPYRLAVTKTR
jgi:subtilisin family serine protease